jgi:hypothetical protein
MNEGPVVGRRYKDSQDLVPVGSVFTLKQVITTDWMDPVDENQTLVVFHFIVNPPPHLFMLSYPYDYRVSGRLSEFSLSFEELPTDDV